MAFSKEYTHWHLTSNGWIAGETRTDFNNFFDIPIPENRVLTIRYEERMSSAFSELKKMKILFLKLKIKI